MLHVDDSVVINKPVEEVWNYFIDHKKMPTWAVGLRDIRLIPEGPIHVGTKCSYTLSFLGKEINSISEVTKFEPNKQYAYKASEPFPITYTYTLEPTPEGTKLYGHIEAEPAGFYKLADPLLIMATKRQVHHSFENLKDLVEAEALVPA